MGFFLKEVGCFHEKCSFSVSNELHRRIGFCFLVKMVYNSSKFHPLLNMQKFKADKNLYLANELKSWLWVFALAIPVYFVNKLFLSTTINNITIAFLVFIFLKIGDTFVQYHIAEIKVDKENNQLIFILKSLMSGEKTTKYALQPAGSELIYNRGMKSLFFSPITLTIYLPYKDKFRISNRYGFSVETLTAIDNTFKSLNNSQHNLSE